MKTKKGIYPLPYIQRTSYIIKFGIDNFDYSKVYTNDTIEFKTNNFRNYKGIYIGRSRIDGFMLAKIEGEYLDATYFIFENIEYSMRGIEPIAQL